MHNWTQPASQTSPQQIFMQPYALYINSLVNGTSGISDQVSVRDELHQRGRWRSSLRAELRLGEASVATDLRALFKNGVVHQF